jgi:hypothetical protein
MATIIKFYKPQSFREGSRAAPPEQFGKVLQFPTSHTENELTPIPLRFDSDKLMPPTETERGAYFEVDR